MLNISRHLLTPCWQGRTGWLSGSRTPVSVSAVLPGDCGADWELWLTALPSITREDWTAYREPGKRSKFKIRITVSTERVSLLHYHEIKKSEVKQSQEPSARAENRRLPGALVTWKTQNVHNINLYYVEGHIVNPWGFVGYMALAAPPQGRRLSVKAATEGSKHTDRTGSQYSFTHGCFEFHIIFMGHKVLSFFRFVLNHLKM